MSRLSRNAFFWFALLLAAGELLAWRSLPYRLVPDAGTAIRNPLCHRGWPEYLDAADDARPLVVLVSNSQGVGDEMPDHDQIYAAALRAHLARAGMRFENWSSRGLRTTELEILIHRAASRGARHVLVVITANNFDAANRLNLRFPFSDIVLLAGAPSLWPELRRAVFMRDTSSEEILSAFAALHSSLVRSRAALTDLAASRIPRSLHRVAFGRQLRPGPRLDEMLDPSISAYFPAVDVTEDELDRRREARLADPDSWNVARLPERLETFRTVYPRLSARLVERGVRLSWVWQPLLPGAGNPEAKASLERFIAEADPIIEASGVRSHDLTEAIAKERFETQAHFDALGHRQFAELLIPIVDDEILDRGRAP